MKVVCIIVLFVIVAVNESATSEANTSNAAKDTKKKNVTLQFPSYIQNPKQLALELLKICKNNKSSHNSLTSRSSYNYYAINDKYVDFKNCTFLCKHDKDINVTLNMPPNTPCGPNGQTCADKSQCVGHIPGC
uniref:Salivary protein 15 Iper-2 n=1 Tax=Ixodes persulcatus TaxID=34615 RepID=SP152_IXOPE|nr:RecName: Full=Salivary protein 15 Iper-2; Short=Salp15 Iper-2; AltName: Full=Salp15-like; Flags: Precursor [Ixodes persulcatus]BAH09311.1 secreted salivary protein Salp15 precursor Iper-2 [Ixodes persulcatus]